MPEMPTYEELEQKVKALEGEVHALKAGRENDFRLELLAESACEGIGIHENGILVDANSQYFRMFGYERAELIGKQAIPLTVAPESIEKLKKQIDSKTTRCYEAVGLRKDGSRFPIEINAKYMQYKERLLRVGVIRDISERKLIEGALRESEEKYRLLYENAGLAIGYWSPDGRVISFNKTAADYMNGSPDQFVGKSAAELFGDELGTIYIERINTAVGTNQRNSYEDTVELPSGESTFLSTYSAIHNHGGTVLGVQIISAEITKLQQVQSNLRASEERFRKLFESSPLPTFVWKLKDGAFFLSEINNAAELLTHGMGRQFLGLSAEEIYPDRPDMIKHFGDCATTRKNTVFQTEYLARGTALVRQMVFTFVFISDELLMLIANDITEQRLTLKALRESEEKLRKVVTTAPYGIQLTDLEGKIIFSNPAHHRIHGCSDGELEGKYIFDLMIDESNREQARSIYQKLTQGLIVPGVIYGRDRTRDGREIDVQVNWDYIYDSAGNIESIISIVSDITGKKILEKQLLQAQKMEAIGNLAGGIAHDFNNILSSIIGFTELALEAAPEGSAQRDDLEEVYIAGSRAKELVLQILAFARQSEEKTKPVRLSDIVKESLKLLRPSTPTTIEIKPTITSTAKVLGNTSQLHQVIMNLCTNAIHSLQKTGGILEICLIDTRIAGASEPGTLVLPDGEYVELRVSDNGAGINREILEKIFEPYFTTKGVGEGTGMGLAMVKGIIESYGGDIRVESEPGKLTSFIVRLPVATGRRYETIEQTDSAVSGTERILFVDDEPPIARMASRMLESLGYKVTMRTSSFEALELFQVKPEAFDLVITDMTMPALTGDVLAVELRKIRHDIPIILCTGYSNKINDEGAKQIGIDGFAYKPFTKPDLAKIIREVLDMYRSSPG